MSEVVLRDINFWEFIRLHNDPVYLTTQVCWLNARNHGDITTTYNKFTTERPASLLFRELRFWFGNLFSYAFTVRGRRQGIWPVNSKHPKKSALPAEHNGPVVSLDEARRYGKVDGYALELRVQMSASRSSGGSPYVLKYTTGENYFKSIYDACEAVTEAAFYCKLVEHCKTLLRPELPGNWPEESLINSIDTTSPYSQQRLRAPYSYLSSTPITLHHSVSPFVRASKSTSCT